MQSLVHACAVFSFATFVTGVSFAQQLLPPSAATLAKEYSRPPKPIQEAKLLYYPPESMYYGKEGKVTVALRIDTMGVVREVTLAKSSGDNHLDAAALAFVAQSRYEPALDEQGMPRGAWMNRTVNFVLN